MTKILDVKKPETKEVVLDTQIQESCAISSKIPLFVIFVTFLGLVFATDYYADWIAAEIQEILISFTHPKDGIRLSRFLIEDVVIDICFLGITGTAFAKYSDAMFCLNNYRKRESEALPWVFFRILRNCLLSAIVWTLFIGILQGLFWWVPKYAVGIYLELCKPEFFIGKGLRNYDKLEIQYLYLGFWLKSINFSLIYLFLVRIGIFVTLIKTFFRRPLNSFVIFLVLLPFIFFASKVFVPQESAQDPSEPKLERTNSRENSSKDLQEKEAPKIHIEVYDPNTGEIRTSDSVK